MSMEFVVFTEENMRYGSENRGPFPIAVVCGGDMTEQLPALAAGHRERILISPKASWERDYTPWRQKRRRGREPFSGGGPRFLEELKEAIPVIGEKHPLLPGRENRAVLGYSLVVSLPCGPSAPGTFSDGCGPCPAPSGMRGGWEYLPGHVPEKAGKVYLSLGKRKKRAVPPGCAGWERTPGRRREILRLAGESGKCL